MTAELMAALLQFGIKFGLDAALAIAQALKGGITIDTAIAALGAAKERTAQQYLDEAKAAVAPTATP
jgi:hypothetical protein